MQCRIVLCNCTIVHQFARKDQVTLVNEIYLRCSHQCSRQFIAKWGWVVSWMYFAVEHLQCDRMTSQQQGRNPPPLLPFLLIHRFFCIQISDSHSLFIVEHFLKTKAFLCQFIFSHICLFYLFYFPSIPILPHQPMSRNATTSFHFCIHLYSMYIYMCTHVSDNIFPFVHTRLFFLAPMCRDTS